MVDPLDPIYSELCGCKFPNLHRFFRFPEVREFATAITQNISDLESQSWISILFGMPLHLMDFFVYRFPKKKNVEHSFLEKKISIGILFILL